MASSTSASSAPGVPLSPDPVDCGVLAPSNILQISWIWRSKLGYFTPLACAPKKNYHVQRLFSKSMMSPSDMNEPALFGREPGAGGQILSKLYRITGEKILLPCSMTTNSVPRELGPQLPNRTHRHGYHGSIEWSFPHCRGHPYYCLHSSSGSRRGGRTMSK